MIRTSLLNQINEMIVGTQYFEPSEFIVNTTQQDDKNVLQIQHRFDTAYRFAAWIPNQKSRDKDSYSVDFRIVAQVCPGEISATENVSYVGRRELFTGIQEWLMRVKDEIVATPAYHRATQQQVQLEDTLKELRDLDDAYFSQEEIDRFKSKLDELELKLAENIRNTVEDQNEQKLRIEKLETEISMLKQKLSSHKKRAWAGSLVSRLIQWAEDPICRKVLHSAEHATKTFMLGPVPNKGIATKDA